MSDDPWATLEQAYSNPQRERFWTPDHEQQFRQFMAMDPAVREWRNAFTRKFGQPPNTENDPSFDYRQAWLSGDRPQPVPHDDIPHWGSSGKNEAAHSTAWMNDFLQQFGVNPTDPGPATPEQSQFLYQQLTKDRLR